MGSLFNYVANEAIAVLSKPLVGAVTSADIYQLGTDLANSGDELVIMSRVDGSITEITLGRSMTSGATTILFGSVTLESTIPAGSIVTYRSDKKWEKIYTSYQYLNCTGKSDAGTSENWKYGHGFGVQFYNWVQDSGATGTTVDSSTLTIPKNLQHIGFRVPYNCTLIGWKGSGKNSNGNRDFAGGLFVGTPQWGTDTDMTMTLRAYSSANNAGGSFTNRPSKFEDLTRSYAISAGDVIYPMIKGLTTTDDTLLINFTIVLKTTLP
tara:strand:+ start:7434 stop:8231 length:798 start_codon:yes stop_codon:yes gene_type:complete